MGWVGNALAGGKSGCPPGAEGLGESEWWLICFLLSPRAHSLGGSAGDVCPTLAKVTFYWDTSPPTLSSFPRPGFATHKQPPPAQAPGCSPAARAPHTPLPGAVAPGRAWSRPGEAGFNLRACGFLLT